MKKTVVLLCMCLSFVAVQAQNKAVNRASRALDKEEYAEAKMQIDQAVEHEKTREKSKTWHTKGQVYGAIALAEDESVQSLAEDPLKEATEAYQKAMELEGKETAPMYVFAQQELENLWGQMINKGATSYEAGDYESAVKHFDRALIVKPADTTAALYAGVAAQQMGDRDLSAEFFYKLVEHDNADADILNALISHERDYKENYDKAMALVKKAQEKYPENVEFKKQEVNILLKQDKTAEAKEQLEQAIEREPDNADLYFNLGFLNEELDNQDAAVEAYRKAVEVDPKHKNAAFNLAVVHYNRGADLVKEANNLGISAADRKKEKQLLEQANEHFKAALPHLDRARELHPDNRTLIEISMVSYDRAGNNEKAEELQAQLDSMPVEE